MTDMPVSCTKVAALKAMLSVVAAETGVPIAELRNRSRLPHLVEARKAFIHRADEAGFGCWSIARALHRDHTTVLHHLGRTTAGHVIHQKLIANGGRVSCDLGGVKA